VDAATDKDLFGGMFPIRVIAFAVIVEYFNGLRVC
jgi:hypothetical protein